jgi:hypothetical protein
MSRNAAAVIMMVAYGYKVTSEDDDFIAAAEETSKITGMALAPGRWMVESFPIRQWNSAYLLCTNQLTNNDVYL